MGEELKQLVLDNKAARADFDKVRSYWQSVADTIHAKFPWANYPKDGSFRENEKDLEAFLLKRYAPRERMKPDARSR